MKTLQLLSAVLLLVVAGCNRNVAEREARETADELRTAAATAGERLADSWLTTKVQAQFFADDDIKARNIDVTTVDGVVTLRGHVESDRVRLLATQIAQHTDGVRQVQDQLAVGQPGNVAGPASSAPVATTGGAPDTALPSETSAAPGVTGDERIVTSIQAKYFLDTSVKSRDIDVESRNGVVTVRGRVGSDSERAQALILARMTPGVQRVEDGLTVDGSLAPAEPIGTGGTTPEQGSAAGAPPSADGTLETSIRQQLSSDTRLAGAGIEVTVKDGVVLVQGTVPDQASKQRVLTMVRQAEGVAQVVDRLSVAGRP
jgi:osmotically-inducible protein OsmY